MEKTRRYLQYLKGLIDSPGGRATVFVGSEIKLSVVKLPEALRIAEVAGAAKGGAYVTAVMVQKAALAAGFATRSDYAECAGAIAALSGDFISAAALAPETLGIGAVLPLIGVATAGFEVGQCVFRVGGQFGHSIRY
jgi:hypothetical protein